MPDYETQDVASQEAVDPTRLRVLLQFADRVFGSPHLFSERSDHLQAVQDGVKVDPQPVSEAA
ncbi:MAG TPA: hypothetical protein VIH90_08135 [Candidatus Saccharimonadales bacterium]